jgi:hypothetical protein
VTRKKHLFEFIDWLRFKLSLITILCASAGQSGVWAAGTGSWRARAGGGILVNVA